MFRNPLLRALNADVIQRLNLRLITFELQLETETPGGLIEHIYFIEEGMASMTTLEDNSAIGTLSPAPVIGLSALLGANRSFNRFEVQIRGFGYSTSVEAARAEFNLGGAFHDLAMRYIHAQLLNATQSAICHRKHNAEQRLAHFLLTCSDQVNSNSYPLSRQRLCNMLGSTSPTVYLAMETLKADLLIDYSRDVVCILDVARLQEKSCSCYRTLKDQFDISSESDPVATTQKAKAVMRSTSLLRMADQLVLGSTSRLWSTMATATVLFGLLEYAVARWLTGVGLAPELRAALQASVVGLGVGLSLLLILPGIAERRKQIANELRRVAELNHSIRNSLELIGLANYNDADRERKTTILECIKRIDEKLKEVFSIAA